MSKISHILLPNPVVVPTGTKLREAAHLTSKNKVPSVLVGKNGKLVGIVSIDDIISRFAYNENIDIAVDQIMHSPEIIIDSDKCLSDAIIMFEQRKVSHITVVENGEKIGIIRAADILHTYLFDWTEKEEKQ